MFSNKIIRYTAYFFAGSVLSEIILRYILRLKRIASEFRPEINEVIFTNNLTQMCSEEHVDKKAKCKNDYCYKNNMNRIVELMDGAKITMDLSMYIFTSYELFKAVQRAHKRGVNVRIITDEKMAYTSGSHIFELHKEGIPVRYQLNTTMLMHHKYCVIDGKVRRLAITQLQSPNKQQQQKSNVNSDEKIIGILLSGSMNWTNQALCGNWDNMIVTSNSQLVEEFENEFERIWNYFGTDGNLKSPEKRN